VHFEGVLRVERARCLIAPGVCIPAASVHASSRRRMDVPEPDLSVPNTVFQEQVEATAGETTTEKGRSAREKPSLTLTLTDEGSVNTVTIV
jgi:hypothetical protein